jgi:superfamily II DNA or RNA helicase
VAKHRTTKPADALAKPGGRPKGFILRPYQQELIDQAGAARKAKRSPLVVLPTGGGKRKLMTLLTREAPVARVSRMNELKNYWPRATY